MLPNNCNGSIQTPGSRHSRPRVTTVDIDDKIAGNNNWFLPAWHAMIRLPAAKTPTAGTIPKLTAQPAKRNQTVVITQSIARCPWGIHAKSAAKLLLPKANRNSGLAHATRHATIHSLPAGNNESAHEIKAGTHIMAKPAVAVH